MKNQDWGGRVVTIHTKKRGKEWISKGRCRYSMQLRLIEESKIHCAREHFKAISGDNVVYDVVDSYISLMEKVMK